MSDPATLHLPVFLQDYQALSDHFDIHFDGLSSVERGRRFTQFALRIMPAIEELADYHEFGLSEKESYDEGVDCTAVHREFEGARLYGQFKYRIRKKDELDGVLSQFQSFEEAILDEDGQAALFRGSGNGFEPHYVVVTLTRLDNILKQFESSRLSSKAFYNRLIDEGRLTIVSGSQVLDLVKGLYRRSFAVPADAKLTSNSGWISHDGVHMGIVRGAEIAALYDEFGEGLFFENIRDFLGRDSGRANTGVRGNVNRSIIETASENPEKMLARNNGITLRAADVKPAKNDPSTVSIVGASIVNGCQTTMCLVHSGDLSDDCYVSVKIVATGEAWEVARAANYQNQIPQVDLDLARYLRPQLAQKAASDLGYGVEGGTDTTVLEVLEAISRREVHYEELKSLYRGVFSRTPKSLWENNYTDLRTDVMRGLYDADRQVEIFEMLFSLATTGRKALEWSESVFKGTAHSQMFKRFWERPKYRAYLAVLTLCGCLDENLAARSLSEVDELARMIEFLGNAQAFLDSEGESFRDVYLLSFQVLADPALDVMEGEGDKGKAMQVMHSKISDVAFDSLFIKLRARMEADIAVRAARNTGELS